MQTGWVILGIVVTLPIGTIALVVVLRYLELRAIAEHNRVVDRERLQAPMYIERAVIVGGQYDEVPVSRRLTGR